MSTETEIKQSIGILLGARLRNMPSRDELPDVVQTWKRIMADIPGATLTQAANDIVISAEFWPTVKQVRDAAYQVRIHNGTSAAANHFAPMPEPSIIWTASKITPAQYTPNARRLVDNLCDRYQGDELPTDEELARVDVLMADTIRRLA